ncbi:MAG: hypothetical protein QOD56_2520 [Gammaproteobacteria bacterium]|nr:hypothetical protein [Gammaproteobacteria bacterium]
MSALDTMTPLISGPWLDADGNPIRVRPLPGLHPNAIRELADSYPGVMSRALKQLLGACCGLAGTKLGPIDFTGCWFPEEPCTVLRPCLTLAIDAEVRRWITEVGETGLPGPVWCVFSEPEVAVYVSDDLAAFIATLRDRTCRGGMTPWLQRMTDEARAVWSRRRALALRPYQACDSDKAIRGWLAGLPLDAYVYDLRRPTAARGWPYGLAGPTGRLYRCGRLPVFAVAGAPSEGWQARDPEAEAIHALQQPDAEKAGAGISRLRPKPVTRTHGPIVRAMHHTPAPIQRRQTAARELRPCA